MYLTSLTLINVQPDMGKYDILPTVEPRNAARLGFWFVLIASEKSEISSKGTNSREPKNINKAETLGFSFIFLYVIVIKPSTCIIV